MSELRLIILCVFLCNSLMSQQINRCGSYEYLQQQLSEDPERAENLKRLEDFTANRIHQPGVVVTIPVVFHVVYENSTENISATRIQEQLTVLNEDFRKLNADAANIPSHFQSVAADSEINFCLATQDPAGNPTTGITRTQTTVSEFSSNDDIKFSSMGGADIWNRNQYLNIWIGDLGSSLLGYAQFPGGAASTDGVVLHYQYTGKTGAFAPYNKGRTATHEVAHWLNLLHIWGDDNGACTVSDGVNDTPNQADETYNCPTAIDISCNNGPNGDMWMNFMDYTDDACMIMFTQGQKSRMAATLNLDRITLKTSLGCGAVSVEEKLARNINMYPSPTQGTLNITSEFLDLQDVSIRALNSLGEEVYSSFTPLISGTYSIDLSPFPAGIYFIELSTGQEKAIKKIIVSK